MNRPSLTWQDDGSVKIIPPKKPKKITGTRLGAVLGINRWSTPFQAWCEITRVYQEPFEGNKYTRAGEAIEPKVIDYLKLIRPDLNIVTPEDVYGPDPKRATGYDFFKDESKVFGGMWDGLAYAEDGKPIVIEVKTTKRAEDWIEGPPPHYEAQAALYAYLLGAERYMVVCAILQDDDYETPEEYVVEPDKIYIYEKELSEEWKHQFEEAKVWWITYVESGVSPVPDELADADVLDILRTNYIEVSDDLESLFNELMVYKAMLKDLDPIKDLYNNTKERIRDKLKDRFTPESDRVAATAHDLTVTLTKTRSTCIDTAKLKADGLYDKYTKSAVSTRMTIKELDTEDN